MIKIPIDPEGPRKLAGGVRHRDCPPTHQPRQGAIEVSGNGARNGVMVVRLLTLLPGWFFFDPNPVAERHRLISIALRAMRAANFVGND